MILVDLNQVMISNLMVTPGIKQNVDENLIRHMVVNTLRGYNVKFSKEYGEMVICTDDKNYWRRDLFPYYKASRKKDREASPYDWHSIFESLNKIRDELKENFPYKVVQVEKCEADDIIGTLCHEYGVFLKNADTERILILSSDKDFMQLQKFVNVDQYSPMAKKFISPDTNPHDFLLEHILRGDRGDGVPNFLSNDDVFICGGRQKPISTKRLSSWLKQAPNEFCNEEMLRNYMRNQMLIDLSLVPEEYKNKILDTYNSAPKRGREKLFNYFIQNRMKQLMEHLQEF